MSIVFLGIALPPLLHGQLRPIVLAMSLVIRTSLAEPETGAEFVPHRPTRPPKAEGGKRFEIVSDYTPAGDQPTAIAELVGFGQNFHRCQSD
jgi:excinuclease ABC subunit B